MLLISQLAKKSGLPVHTIRFYERSGLFKGKKDPSVKSNNYTYYDNEVVEKLELIAEAKSVGFTLNEIKELVDAWYSKRLSKTSKIEVLAKKKKSVEEKIKHLQVVKKLISRFMKDVEEFDC